MTWTWRGPETPWRTVSSLARWPLCSAIPACSNHYKNPYYVPGAKQYEAGIGMTNLGSGWGALLCPPHLGAAASPRPASAGVDALSVSHTLSRLSLGLV